jgi:hypothetical protein
MTDRMIVYPGAAPLDSDVLNTNRFAMIALGGLMAATIGPGTYVDGLALSAAISPPMNVVVGIGTIFAIETIDATAYGSLPSDSAPLIKMGHNYEQGSLATCAAPTTPGQSINYLIEAAFSEPDGAPVVLPYYNPSNPSQVYNGPNNTGDAQNSIRQQRVAITAKAGTPATTGTQTTPAPDDGNVGLYVVTVAYGATSVTSANFSQYPGAPFIPSKLGNGGVVTTVNSNISLTFGNLGGQFVVTAPMTFTLPPPWSVPNGYEIGVVGRGGSATFQPDATTSVAGGATGASYLVYDGTSARIVKDDTGNWSVFYVTPRLAAWQLQIVSVSQTITPNGYIPDTRGGPIILTLETSPSQGDNYQFKDTLNCLGQNSMIIDPGSAAIEGASGQMVCNIPGTKFTIVYDAGNWVVNFDV